MTRSIIIALLLTLQGAGGAVPRLFQQKEFTAASFAEAVNHFVALGEEAAIQKLRGLATDGMADFKRGFSVNERIGWICRVLFEAKTGSLRPPGFGSLSLPDRTMPAKTWPLYPVALSCSTYFVLSEGYSLDGLDEDPRDYIDHCHRTGVFRKEPVGVPTRAQAVADASALRHSVAWKAIQWKDGGQNWSYALDEEWVWSFIQKQAEDIQ